MKKMTTAGLLVSLAILLSTMLYYQPAYSAASNSELKVIVIDVGQGLSELVILPDGKAMLIDGGDRDQGNTVLSALQQNGIKKLDVVVATHPHADHIGGLVAVLKSVQVDEVIDSGQVYTTQTFENFVDAIDSKKIPLRSVHDGDAIDLDPAVALNVLNPPANLPVGADSEPDFNNNSVAIKLTYGNFTAMLPGDMQMENEERLATRGNIDVDVLVAGHHGSRTSSSAPFLAATSPDAVIISVGAGNTYGHPHPEALTRINAAGVSHVLRTDLDGTVTVTATADGNYSIGTGKTHKVVTIPEFAGITTPTLVASISLIIAFTIIHNNNRRGGKRLREGNSRQG